MKRILLLRSLMLSTIAATMFVPFTFSSCGTKDEVTDEVQESVDADSEILKCLM